MSKIVILDIETTGFSRQWDYIIELAAISYDTATWTEIDRFHEYIKPGKSIPANVTNLTGISNYTVKSCRDEKSVLMDFAEWFAIQKPTSIVGHNCKTFDLQFIREKNTKYCCGYKDDGIEVIDTLAVARQLKKNGKLPTENLQQKTIAAYFGIEYEAHSAINDVEALSRIYQELQKLTQPVTRETLGF